MVIINIREKVKERQMKTGQKKEETRRERM